ncbi:18670_t:CDS:1, partial [Acaulospora morrowiae]
YLVTAATFNFMFVESVNYPVSFNSPDKPKKAHSTSNANVKNIAKGVCAAILIISGISFIYFSQFTYGIGSESDVVSSKKWLETWDFQYQAKNNKN